MRVSVNKDDPGFVKDSHLYEIFFNDKKINNCITADEETGYVLCNKVDDNGDFILNKEKEEIVREELTGKVVIKKNTEFSFGMNK